MMNLLSLSAEHTMEIGSRIGSFLRAGDVIALEGTLAAGKTTITKGIARALDIQDPVTSPTFTLVSEYYGRLTLYHMDVYRLDSIEEFLNLGVEEMLYGDGVCIVEWSDKISEVLPDSTITIMLSIPDTTDQRLLSIENWPYGDLDL